MYFVIKITVHNIFGCDILKSRCALLIEIDIKAKNYNPGKTYIVDSASKNYVLPNHSLEAQQAPALCPSPSPLRL